MIVGTPSSLVDLERRARPRYYTAIEVEMDVLDQGVLLHSRTVDLSNHGAFVRCHHLLPIGTRVRISFGRGVERNPLILEAEIVRSGFADGGRTGGIGLRFCSVKVIDEYLINDMIQRATA